MHPISTRRSPARGSRPVVSVSKIISRIEGLIWTLSGAETRGDGTNLAMRLAFRAAGFDDEIGARALHPIGQLKRADRLERSEEQTSELQSLMRISYAVFCLKKKKSNHHICTT